MATEMKYRRNFIDNILVERKKANFNKACESAQLAAVVHYGIDANCNSNSVDWCRSTDSIVILFKSVEIHIGYLGFSYHYIFCAWIERFDDGGELVAAEKPKRTVFDADPWPTEEPSVIGQAVEDSTPNDDGTHSVTVSLGPHSIDAQEVKSSYQSRVYDWMNECFGKEISKDKIERNFRFLEEALELFQANFGSRTEALELVDYVFARNCGSLFQEIGGVMVTLAALCEALGFGMDGAGEVELDRVWENIEKIRAKHAAKPKGIRCALPGDPDKPNDTFQEEWQ